MNMVSAGLFKNSSLPQAYFSPPLSTVLLVSNWEYLRSVWICRVYQKVGTISVAQLLMGCLIKLLHFCVTDFPVLPQCVACEPAFMSLLPSLTPFDPFQMNLIETWFKGVSIMYF